MRQGKRLALIACLVTLGLVLAGLFAAACGDGGSSDGQGTEVPGNGTPGNSDGLPDGGPTDNGAVGTVTPAPNGQNPGTGSGGPGAPARTPLPTSLPSGPAMKLTLVSGGSCDGSDCFVDTGSTFTLGVEVVRGPAAGYVLMQTFIDFGVFNPDASEDGGGPGSCSDGVENAQPGDQDGADRKDSECATVALTYLPTSEATDEVVWPDAASDVTVRSEFGPGLLLHGSLTGLVPPLPASDAVGLMVQVQMSCPADAVTVPISLLTYDDPVAGSSGSLFVEPPGVVQVAPFVSPINLHCQ